MRIACGRKEITSRTSIYNCNFGNEIHPLCWIEHLQFVHFPGRSLSERCRLPNLPPRFSPSPTEQIDAYRPFSFHTLYHFSSLTVFWRLGFKQCCCSPLTRVHRVTLQGKRAQVRGVRGNACPLLPRQANTSIGQGALTQVGSGRVFMVSILWQIFEFIVIILELIFSCYQSMQCSIVHHYTWLYQMKICPLLLISGFTLSVSYIFFRA